MRDLQGRIVVVTGAGSGIGRASALAFARAGARVHLVDIRADRITSTVSAMGHGQSVVGHVLDCSDGEAIEQLAAQIFAEEGRVDVLQNGVGVLVAGPVDDLKLDQWRRAVDINIWSVIHAVRSFIPRMLRQGGRSHLVNIASVAGLVAFPFTAPYSASKFAIVGLSEALAAELHGRGICVTCVCPGMVRSELITDGQLALPGNWRRVVDWAYRHLARSPEALAHDIVAAVRRDRPQIVPALLLGRLWQLKRFAPGYPLIARQLVRPLLALLPERPEQASADGADGRLEGARRAGPARATGPGRRRRQ